MWIKKKWSVHTRLNIFLFPCTIISHTKTWWWGKKGKAKRGIEQFSQIFIAYKILLQLRSMKHVFFFLLLENEFLDKIIIIVIITAQHSTAACEDSIFKSARECLFLAGSCSIKCRYWLKHSVFPFSYNFIYGLVYKFFSL